MEVTADKTASTAAGCDSRIDDLVPYSAICQLFEKCSRHSKHAKKKNLLQKFFSLYKTNDYFPLMRLLLPQLDKERQAYGLKETTLGKLFVKILNISPTSEDATRLLNWRKPTKTAQGQIEGGDFGMAVYLSLQNRAPEKGNCTLSDINNYLDDLNRTTESKDRVKIMQSLLRRTTAIEQKWLVRIILKELKMGLSEKSILNYYHEDAIDLYNVTSNLRRVCQVLKDPQIRLSGENIGLFHPIKPMLASRHLPEQVLKLMDGHKFIIETKFDGERIQVHKDCETVKLYSRNSNDCTSIYGEKLLPLFQSSIKVNQCILDGELLVWDTITERFEDFGKLKTFAKFDDGKRLADVGGNYGKQLCYIIFDILFVNGKSVMDLTFNQRISLLKRCVPNPKPKLIELASQKTAETTNDIIEALDNAIENGEEGLVIKNLDSLYKPNERKEKWIKLKPEYLDGVGDTLDLLILGGYYGAGIGRRGGTVSHFLLGIQKHSNLFYSVARVGSGFSDEELKDLQSILASYWKPYNPQDPPNEFLLADPNKDKPHVWIEPKYSKVLEVRAAQIVPSEKYKAGYTLRFPRVLKIRNDKSFKQTMNLDELLSLAKLSEGRLSRKGRQNVNQDSLKLTNKPRKRLIIKKPFSVASNFLPTDPTSIKVETDLFGKLEFCVINGDDDFTKEDLETLVYQYGGQCTQYPTDKTFAVVAAKETLKVKNIQLRGEIDIIRHKWILDCIGKENLLSLEPRYMIHASPSTQTIFKNDIDKFGDSFTTDTTVENLREILKEISNSKQEAEEDESPQKKPKKSFTEYSKQFFDKPFWSIFQNYVFYFDRYEIDSGNILKYDSLEICEKLAKFYGAKILPIIDHETTHVILDPQPLDSPSILLHRYKQIYEQIAQLKKNINHTNSQNNQQHHNNNDIMVLSKEWIYESIASRNDLDEHEFLLSLQNIVMN